MQESLNYWLSLIAQGEYEVLEKEMEEALLLTHPLDYTDLPDITLDEAYNIAQDYNNE